MVTNLSTLIARDISCTVSGQAEEFYLRRSWLRSRCARQN